MRVAWQCYRYEKLWIQKLAWKTWQWHNVCCVAIEIIRLGITSYFRVGHKETSNKISTQVFKLKLNWAHVVLSWYKLNKLYSVAWWGVCLLSMQRSKLRCTIYLQCVNLHVQLKAHSFTCGHPTQLCYRPHATKMYPHYL